MGLFQAATRRERERAFELVSRRFSAQPELWLFEAIEHAYYSNRPRAVRHFFQYADSVRRPNIWVYRLAAYAFHQLGDHTGQLAVAERMRSVFPERKTHDRTVELMARVGTGDIAGVRRILAEAEATPEVEAGEAGSRAYIAALELMPHGHDAEARRMFAEVLPVMQRLKGANELPAAASNNEITIHWLLGDLVTADRRVRERLSGARTDGDSLAALALLGMIDARRGNHDSARRYSALLGRSGGDSTFGRVEPNQARIAASLGDREGAVRLLEAARRAGNDAIIWFNIHRDPAFASLRGYPPFEQSLKPNG